ncbi:MAG: aspartate 1-decarboxylase [Candidatus Aminicenantes bacterium]|nr:aspartate 1-decarboxylase [Candidatus Aminicenantes bacterium]
MLRAFLRSKIHRASVTHVDIDYEGILSIDEDLMAAAGDIIIIAAYGSPKIVLLGEGNRFADANSAGDK